jgi:hypothetical protein
VLSISVLSPSLRAAALETNEGFDARDKAKYDGKPCRHFDFSRALLANRRDRVASDGSIAKPFELAGGDFEFRQRYLPGLGVPDAQQ